jgi:hypothetical protein
MSTQIPGAPMMVDIGDEEHGMAKSLKRAFGLGLLSAGAYAVWRAFETRRHVSSIEWESQPFPFPPAPKAPGPKTPAPTTPAPTTPAPPAWVQPVDGECPVGFPIKAKLSSKIFHAPGGANYERTVPDRCYRDAVAAEADGLRAAKR